MTSLPPLRRRATSRRITRSPSFCSWPPMMMRTPRLGWLATLLIMRLCAFILAPQKHLRGAHVARDVSHGEVGPAVRPTDPAVRVECDPAGLAANPVEARNGGPDGKC